MKARDGKELFRIDVLMKRDRGLRSSWVDAAFILDACLRDGTPEQGLPVVEWLRSDAWLGGTCSDYYPLAAAIYARSGKIDEAVSLVREAFRYGYHGLWKFDGAYGSYNWRFDAEARHWVDAQGRDPHADDPQGINAHHAYLQPLYQNPEIREIVARFQREWRALWEGAVLTRPLCWWEPTTLNRKRARCGLTGGSLVKGDAVVAYRHFAGARDLATDPLVARPEAFETNATARETAAKYHADSYSLADFAFSRSYRHPWINGMLLEPDDFDLDRALDFLTSPGLRPTPYWLLRSPGHWERDPEPVVAHGRNRELLDFLWMLVKSGQVEAILKRLPELPRAFGLTLMLLDRADLRARVGSALGLPEIVEPYTILSRPRLGAKDIASLARFGRDNAVFRSLLADSLNTYEYHLCSNYCHSPNWFFQDFHYLARARAGYLLYLLAAEPTLLPPLERMVRERCVVTGGATAADVEYGSVLPHVYGTVLLHAALTSDEELAFWQAVPERFGFARLTATRKLILKVASLL